MKRILSLVMALFLVLGTASIFAVSAEEFVDTNFSIEIESVTYTEEDNPAAGDTISLEVYVQNLTDEDDLGSVECRLNYDSSKLKFVAAREKTGTGKKAVTHMAGYFGLFQSAAPDTNPAKNYIVNVDFENQCWDSEWDINNDIFFMADFEIVGDWGGSTEIQVDGQAQRRADSLFYRGENNTRDIIWGKGTVTRPGEPEPEVVNTLTVSAEGNGTVDATVNGSATTGITTATEFAPEAGSAVSLEAKGENFLYWKNALSGAVISQEASLNWIDAGSVRNLVAVFADDVAETFEVLYKDSLTGKIFKVETVAPGTVLTEEDMPEEPSLLGYAFNGFKAGPVGGKTKAAIGYEVNENIVVFSNYLKDNSTTYTLNVNANGKTYSYQRSFAAIGTVTCLDDTFSYWQDENGTVLSLDAQYKFSMPNKDVTLTAVCGAQAPEAVLAFIENTLDGDKIVTTITRDLADGLTLVESGILYTRNASEADLVVPKTNIAVTQGISTADETESVYGFVKSVANKAGTWLVRGYMTYADDSGALTTVYTTVDSIVVA